MIVVGMYKAVYQWKPYDWWVCIRPCTNGGPMIVVGMYKVVYQWRPYDWWVCIRLCTNGGPMIGGYV